MSLILAILFAVHRTPAQIRADSNATFEEMVSLPIVYSAPGADRVVVRHSKNLDVYLPADSKSNHGVVLFVHGGVGPDEHPKDWGFYRSWGRTIAASGLVAVIPDTRLGFPVRRYEEGAADLRDAMEFIRQRLKADRVCVFAFSGGGTLLAPLLRSAPPEVRCLIGFYPILDTADTNNAEAEVTDAQRREYSAVSAASEATSIPLLIARAGRDQIPGARNATDRFVDAALQHDLDLTLLVHPVGRHGFDSLNDDDRSREIILTAIEFMKRHLR